jgi:hypothetical protein
MKITKRQLIRLIKESMYDPRQGLKKRQKAYDEFPPETRDKLETFLSSDDEFDQKQGHSLIDSLTGYEGKKGGYQDQKDYDMIDVNYILSEIPELSRLRDEAPDMFKRVIHTIRSGHIHVRSGKVSKGVVPTLSDMSTLEVYDIATGGDIFAEKRPDTSLSRSHWHNYVYDLLNQNHPPIGFFQNDPKNKEESQQASRKLIQFMLDQGAQVDLEVI